MVERLVRHEAAAGRFLKPAAEEEVQLEEEKPAAAKKADLVEALLASEASRKKELELKKQQEEAEAAKRKDLKAMTNDELKKALSKNGVEPMGKKDDMVEALFQIAAQKEKLDARKAHVKAMGQQDLKKLLSSKGIESSGGKDAMVQAVLAHEANAREQLKVYGVKVEEALAKKREELDAYTPAELKDMCTDKGLKPGLGKDECIERLIEEARRDGEIDKVL